MVARLSLLQLFRAFAVAIARNDPRQVLRELGHRRIFRITNATLPHIIPRQRKAARGRDEPASANGTRLTAEWQTETMSGCRTLRKKWDKGQH